MNRALILLGHPVAGSFNSVLATSYARGFESGGGLTETIVLSELNFDPVLRGKGQSLEPDLLALRRSIERASHLVWVFPTYWGSAPALVRGVIDRVFLPGWAYRHEGKPLPTGLLKGRSARVVTTMDSPWFWYWLAHRGSVHSTVGTATLSYVGVAPIRYSTVYGVRKLSDAARQRWAERLFQCGAKDARRWRGLPASVEGESLVAEKSG
jgi:putative NADPH-quinone reductase